MKKIPQDLIGNIAILKFKRYTPWIIKKFKAHQFIKNHKQITTVVEKTKEFSGKMRIPETKYLAGKKTYETIYKENGYQLKFNINETYFSPRLSQERKIVAEEIAKKSKRNSDILVTGSGVGPFPIAIAKALKKENKKAKIIANEINPEACLYAKENIKQNKVQEIITIVNDDTNNLPKDIKKKYDIIFMARPNIEDTFLKSALKMSKKGTIIMYHGFGTEEKVLNEIKRDTKGKIGKIKIRKAGDIGPGKFRYHAEFKVK